MSHYISLTEADRQAMLEKIGVKDQDALFAAIPEELRYPELKLPAPLSEIELRRELGRMAGSNGSASRQSIFLGAGAYNHFVPSAIDQILRRSEFYTAYTPYQPEVSQGTLQAIFEYQSLICALTGMDVANASHYDGGTALAEAAIMAVASTRNRTKVILAPSVNPQYRKVIRTLLQGTNISIRGDENLDASLDEIIAQVDSSTAALIIQSPDFFGTLHDIKPLVEAAHAQGALLVQHFDPIALALFQTPGEAGADIATAEGQPLGVGLNYGGPYLGIFTSSEKYMRRMPGRLTGMTRDVDGKLAYVLTLQAREQHIRREHATSNICTNQGLMALAAAVYLSLMGRNGMRQAAELCYHRAHYAAQRLAELPGYEVLERGPFFKEFVLRCPRPVSEINAALQAKDIIGGYDLGHDYPALKNCMLLCVTEMTSKDEIDALIQMLNGEFNI